MSITLFDLNIVGMFAVKDISKRHGEIIYQYNGEGYGDIPFDISYRKVLAIYAKNNIIIVEV